MPGIAGALIDFRSLDIAEDKKINVKEHLENYDSYNLFKKIGNSLVTTGHTGTNVGDVVVYLLR
jgi:hydroxypyruvate reductase/glycerate 2-kinase